MARVSDDKLDALKAAQAQRLIDDPLLWEILDGLVLGYIKAIEDAELTPIGERPLKDDDYCRSIRSVANLRRALQLKISKHKLKEKQERDQGNGTPKTP